ncbi:MAG: hypothetical protein ABWX70_07090 [Hyphomicrobium sp.]
MPHNLPATGTAHPAPKRDTTNEGVLWFSVFAAPLAWAAHLLVNYTIAGRHCVGAAEIGAIGRPEGQLAVIVSIDIAAALVAIVAGDIAVRRWRETKSEKGGGTQHLVHSGEGRTRFLAMSAMLTSGLFGLAVVIDAIGTILGPPC